MRFCQAVSAKKDIRHADILHQWPSGSKVNRVTHVYLENDQYYKPVCVYVCKCVCVFVLLLFVHIRLRTSSEHPNAVLQNAPGDRFIATFQFDFFHFLHTTRSTADDNRCDVGQTTTTITTVLRPFFRDHPGEPVPEENCRTLWCKGRLTEADTPTIRLGATALGLTSAQLHHPLGRYIINK